MSSRASGRSPVPPEVGYEVGYGRPPQHTQFVKGQSGNPRGRPAGSKNLATLLARELDQPVQVVENGRRRKISKRQVITAQLVNKSIAGDLRATKMVYDLLRDAQRDGRADNENLPGSIDHDPDDQAIIERFLAKKGAIPHG
jgi:hypothetical protein